MTQHAENKRITPPLRQLTQWDSGVMSFLELMGGSCLDILIRVKFFCVAMKCCYGRSRNAGMVGADKRLDAIFSSDGRMNVYLIQLNIDVKN